MEDSRQSSGFWDNLSHETISQENPSSTDGRIFDEDKLYTYIFIRNDLDMTPGKLSAQASHAAVGSMLSYLARYPEHLMEFHQKGFSGSRIVLKAKNLHALERARQEAKEANLPHYMMTDSQHVIPDTVFTGEAIVTALGIGPCTKEEIRHIAKRFNCLG